jgi:autotransporter-associated beta strand protein
MKPSRRNRFLFHLFASGVLSSPQIHAAGVEVAGNLLVELRADDASAGTATWTNTGSEGDFNLVAGGDPVKTTIGGVDYVRLDPNDHYVGTAAPSQITGAGTRTVEVWVKNDAVADEEIMVSWGMRGADARNYAFTYGSNPTWGALGAWGAPDLGWGTVPAAGQLHHLVVTYDGTTTSVYSDGALINSEVLTLNTYDVPNNFIVNGSWQGDNTSIFNPASGEMDYAVIRVYDGALTPTQIQANFNAGWTARVVTGPHWSGASGSDWGTAGNWDPNGVPAAEGAVVFGSAGATGTVVLDTARSQSGLGFDSAVSTTISSGGATLTLGDGVGPAVVEAQGVHTISAPLAFASPVSLGVNGAGSTLTLSGAISGSAGLTKAGGGTLILSGSNSYSGDTVVNGGLLRVDGGSTASLVSASKGGVVSGSGNSSLKVTVGSSGKLAPGSVGTVGTTTVEDLTMTSGGVLEVDLGVTNDVVSVADTLTLTAGGVRLLTEGSGTAFSTPGTYTIATFGSLIGSPSNLTVTNAASGLNYSVVAVGSELRVIVAGAPVWNGGGDPSTQWDIAANWSGVPIGNGSSLVFGPAPTAPLSNNNITAGSYQSLLFTETSPGYEITGNPITLTGNGNDDLLVNLSPEQQTVAVGIQLPETGNVVATGADVYLTGAISGSGGVVKRGSNYLVLGGDNSFTGGVTVEAGTLGVGSATALGTGTLSLPGGTISNVSGAPLTVTTANPQVWDGNFAFTGPALDMGSSAVTLAQTSRLNIEESLAVGTVNGDHRLIVQGGVLSLGTGASTFQELRVGWGPDAPDADGELSLTSGTPAVQLSYLGLRGVTKAHMDMSAGTLGIAGDWRFGHDFQRGSAFITGGTVNHAGGVLDLGFNGAQAHVSFGGNSVYNGSGLVNIGYAWQSRSTLTIEDNASVTTGDIWLGAFNAVPDSVNLANLTVRDSATLTVNGNLLIGREGSSVIQAQFNQSGGSTAVSGVVRLTGDNAVSPADSVAANLNLRSGQFSTTSILGGTGTSYLNFLGGTLAFATAEFHDLGGDHLCIYEDAVINAGSEDVNVSGILESPSGRGVSAVTVTDGGSGYQLLPPMVRFNGGNGGGASAVAVVDPVTGVVTGIQITSPGSGYDAGDGLVVELYGGSGSGATIDPTAVLASNAAYDGALIKDGSGVMTIFSPPAGNFRSDIEVREGTLSTSYEFVGDAATVRLAAGATLDLVTSGATDRVKRLFIDNIQQADGTWGAPGSGAQHTTSQITGDGFLLVDGTASPFETWVSDPEFGLDPADQGADADPDEDGVSNLLEFALAGDPSDGSEHGRSSVIIQDTNGVGGKELTLVAAVRRGATFTSGIGGSQTATVDELTYKVAGSLGLENFDQAVSVVGAASDTAPPATGLPSLAGEEWEYRVFKLDASEGLSGKGFLRVEVE